MVIFTEEAAIARAPVPFLTISSVAPTLMLYGTEEQKKSPAEDHRGRAALVHGYSEPGAGSDLASLHTSAVRDGDDYVINGQKIWTCLSAHADWMLLAVRTDPDAPKHRGISMLDGGRRPRASPARRCTPGGRRHQRDLYSDVRVPVTNQVGEENGGWKLVTTQLNHERVALMSPGPIFLALREVREWAQKPSSRRRRLIDAAWVQPKLARVHANVEVLKLINWELASAHDDALNPADASAAKVFGTELATEAYRLLMEVLGTAATLRQDSPGALLRGRVERMHRACLILTFGGGTNEVQRDIIGMVALGLPRNR